MDKKRHIEPGTIFGSCIYLRDVPNPRRRHSLFLCHCGAEFVTCTTRMISGVNRGCGCSIGSNLIEQNKISHPRLDHGFCKDKRPEYGVWNSMLSRCSNPKNRAFVRYGGRGIAVCERWLKFSNFIEDMGARPSSAHSIERVDNDGGYEKSNCKWALPDEQRANRSDNRNLEFNGENKAAFLWGRDFGIKGAVILKRIARGWSVERAITTPNMAASK